MALSFPFLLQWHHFLLVCFWNSAVLVFFLPGQPSLGAAMGFFSLLLSFLTRTLTRRSRFLSVPSITWPLLLMGAVIIMTAELSGGIGARALGSETWGAKRYLGVLGAIAGYFALTAQEVDKRRAILWTSLFILSGVTVIVSDLAYAAGPRFYFLFSLFPSELAYQQAATQSTMARYSGPTWAALAVHFFMLMRYGIRGILDLTRPWRLLIFLALFGVSLVGGYRSSVILLLVMVTVQFFFEGLFRSKLFPALLLAGFLAVVFLVGFVDRLPLSAQRSLSFLPLNIDPVAKADALGTLDWRLQMWKTLLPDVPRYFFLGKGFSFSGTDALLTDEAVRRGFYTAYEGALVAGAYHSGPLTILIPFGIWGVLGFVAFCIMSLRVLHKNYRYGDPALANINTFLLAYFWARLIFYLFFYGQFELDFFIFTGTVGLSVCLNHGVCEREPAPLQVAPPVSDPGLMEAATPA